MPSVTGRVGVNLPSGLAALFFLLTLALVGGVRFLVRAFYERPLRGFKPVKGARRVLIVGAGDGGQLVLREILRNPSLGLNPVGFVDDDPLKRGLRFDGVRVLGPTVGARRASSTRPSPTRSPSRSRRLPARCARRSSPPPAERGIPVRTLPTVFELLLHGGDVVRQARQVQVEDILGREPVRMEIDRVGAYLNNEVVMITGAGGSIGSELCRQIARVGAAQADPRSTTPRTTSSRSSASSTRTATSTGRLLAAILADCKEGERMREVFAEHRPTVVFHAAAYKHVGLMETNPIEAVRNNAIATRRMAHLAGEHAVKTFVLVSTDKAVEPTTVMGASKALAEWAVEEAHSRFAATRFSSVRFGNVLGSSGSVVPIFRRQIALGGPVTVTDERMTRYFMTIPEAVQLIVRAGSLEESGAVYVLEMGEPVKIIDLARDMIELSGLVPGRDVSIEVVGRRPGEKLHEELFNSYERPQPTRAEKIVLAEREPIDPRSGRRVLRSDQPAGAGGRRRRARRPGVGAGPGACPDLRSPDRDVDCPP